MLACTLAQYLTFVIFHQTQSEGQDTLAYAEDKAGKTKKAAKQKGQETKKTAEETLQQ